MKIIYREFLLIALQAILFLISQVSSIPYDVYSLITENLNNTNRDPLDNTCFCDKITNACDPFCCCDDQCFEFTYATGSFYWTMTGQCLPQPTTQYEKYFKNCRDSNFTSVQDDLYSPIRVFYQNIRKGFCLSFNNGEGFNKTITNNFNVTNTTDFTDLVKKYKNVTYVNEKNYFYNSDTFINNIPHKYGSNFQITNYTGYLPNDPILIQKTTSKYDTLRIPISNSYGRCKNNLDSIRYLRNREVICSYKMTMNSNDCMNFNLKNFAYDSQQLLLSYNSTLNITQLITPVISIYKVTDKLYFTKMSDNKFTTSGFNVYSSDSNNKCTCSNIITKVNLELQMLNETVVGFNINYFAENIRETCYKDSNIPTSYKVNFVTNTPDLAYSRSGNPGYIKGKPLLAGKDGDWLVFNNISGLNETSKYVQQFYSPRFLYGVGQDTQDRGLCYHNTALSGIDESILPYQSFNLITVNVTNPDDNTTSLKTIQQAITITPESSTALPYIKSGLDFEKDAGLYHNTILDNVLTYEDKISWGCVDKLNITGLKYFCTNQLWKQKALFNIIKNLTFISQFGNANRHFTLDWITVEPFSLDNYQSIWDETYNKCTIPAVLNVDILYASYGAVNNTQEGIFKVQYRMDYIYWWGKNIQDKQSKDNFYTYININYFRIPQDTVWWFAPGPGFIKLPRNIMYPFRIGTTAYGLPNSAAIPCASWRNLFFILILILLIN